MMRAASVIVEDRNGCVLLLLRGPTAPWMPLRWNLPGGLIEPGETSAQAAARETREEAGLHVHALAPLARARMPNGGTLDVFYAERWSGRLRLDEYENVSHTWVPRATVSDWDLIPPQRDVLRWFARR
jgi:8-oxo-dGTP diphosphatase